MSEAFTIAEYEKAYKIGHTKVAELIKSGELITYKIGRRRYVSRRAAQELQERLEGRPAQQAEAVAA
ncbi:MAG: hypothetical protein KDH93_19180 [Rhodoferax sp.]|nr:hypothetical protein [Rhodoferax sp.]MCB2007148.1 hypothetical protein [Rhodoferax sp.]MCB2027792.1 hypothetical protein [Rhodoferax sp.]MCP5262403.1 excisionase [Rhodoferax sp.]